MYKLNQIHMRVSTQGQQWLWFQVIYVWKYHYEKRTIFHFDAFQPDKKLYLSIGHFCSGSNTSDHIQMNFN